MNDRIRAPEIRLIGADGENVGVVTPARALAMAEEAGLDLVEISPNAEPPVCKIMDFGKFKYEEKKKQADAKKRQSQIELKEIKLRPKTDDHDLAFKIKHVQRFLEDGNKVKLTVRFRGREITHPETARKQIEYILDAVKEHAIVEAAGRMEGRTMTALLAPKVERKPRDVTRADGPGGGRRRDEEEEE